MKAEDAVTDVKDAMSAGFDAFALNTNTLSADWSKKAIDALFAAAEDAKFKLFFSFDTNSGMDVKQIADFLAPYAKKDAHYKVDGKPFVSTFNGGKKSSDDWKSGFIEPLKSTHGITPFFVPDFDDADNYPTDIFKNFPFLDGVFSWESAWPADTDKLAHVSDDVDSAAMQQAHDAGKTYMMRESIQIIQPPL